MILESLESYQNFWNIFGNFGISAESLESLESFQNFSMIPESSEYCVKIIESFTLGDNLILQLNRQDSISTIWRISSGLYRSNTPSPFIRGASTLWLFIKRQNLVGLGWSLEWTQIHPTWGHDHTSQSYTAVMYDYDVWSWPQVTEYDGMMMALKCGKSLDCHKSLTYAQIDNVWLLIFCLMMLFHENEGQDKR